MYQNNIQNIYRLGFFSTTASVLAVVQISRNSTVLLKKITIRRQHNVLPILNFHFSWIVHYILNNHFFMKQQLRLNKKYKIQILTKIFYNETKSQNIIKIILKNCLKNGYEHAIKRLC